jgi:hypothetical protein
LLITAYTFIFLRDIRNKMSDQSNAENRLQQIKDQNKARAKKYYEAHKIDIAAKRKAKRAAEKENAGLNEIVVPVPNAQVVTKAIAKELKAAAKVEELKEQSVRETLRILQEKGVHKTDINNTKQLNDILDITNIYTAFKKPTEVIKKIEEATLKSNSSQLYSLNSKKSMYQTVLKLNTVLGLGIPPKDLDKYKTVFEEYKVDSHLQSKERAETEEVMDFDEYLEQIAEDYDVGSKEYLIASLYQLHGFRDNLQLKIIQDASKSDPKQDINYVVVPLSKKTNCTIILNTYKTEKKYGQVFVSIPRPISNLIRDYVDGNRMKENTYIFGNKLLSKFISKFNHDVGLPVTIDTYRQMRVSNAYEHGLDTKQRVQLAKEMHHAPSTSETYRRIVKRKK